MFKMKGFQGLFLYRSYVLMDWSGVLGPLWERGGGKGADSWAGREGNLKDSGKNVADEGRLQISGM